MAWQSEATPFQASSKVGSGPWCRATPSTWDGMPRSHRAPRTYTYSLFKDRFQSSRPGGNPSYRGKYRANDEMLVFFGISPGGWVPIHHGQDQRINMQLCLFGCENAHLVAQGHRHQYRAGELVAFDDAGDHEMHNEDPERARVVLGWGILNPAITPAHGFCFSEREKGA